MISKGRYSEQRWTTETGDLGDWRDKARCREAPKEIADLFWEPTEGSISYSAAQKLCIECPVRAECLEANIEELDGIFGGLTPKERKQLRARPTIDL